ncbi:hypothetical protein [Chlamydia felis Fe/C-56]|uniref:Ubiquitin-like protease family profile domain-containing protein n=1 Tax=Chlamydia felis (strain Fe/C-56) TaxID=264202 RepID=Q255G6_CHLFF|nr:Ulp1 family isopeptidase [Chlamydia felis]BAE81072.1 hypothetical protein [Chlamydia felis Fe/C-56]
MANFLLSPPTVQPGSIYSLYNSSPPLSGEQNAKSVNQKTPITGPGSFDNASFLSKLARVVLAAVLIIITLGLILCFMSTQNILDLDIQTICVDTSEYDYLPYLPYGLDPEELKSEPDIVFASWDSGQILTHFLRLSETHPNLFVPSLTTIPTCFSLERMIASDIHCYDRDNQQFLDQPDLNHCYHRYPDYYPHLEGKNCQNFRVFAYPVWHHPMATTEDDMMARMLATAQAQYAGISHWTLVIVNLDLREVVYFDSLAHFIPNESLDPMLKSIAIRLGTQYPNNSGNPSPFAVRKISKTVVQKDGASCGIWVSLFLEKYLENPQYIIPTMGCTQTQRFLQNFLDTIPQRPLTQISERTRTTLNLVCINSPS